MAGYVLPFVYYDGEVVLVERSHDVAAAVGMFVGESSLGVSFQWPDDGGAPLVQVASERRCAVFRLSRLGFLPAKLRKLLTTTAVLKVVAALDDSERLKLMRLYDLSMGATIDVVDLSRSLGYRPASFRQLVRDVLQKDIDRSLSHSNWEARILSADQVSYVATDAWAVRAVHQALAWAEIMQAEDQYAVVSPPSPQRYMLAAPEPEPPRYLVASSRAASTGPVQLIPVADPPAPPPRVILLSPAQTPAPAGRSFHDSYAT